MRESGSGQAKPEVMKSGMVSVNCLVGTSERGRSLVESSPAQPELRVMQRRTVTNVRLMGHCMGVPRTT
jgi:hypothetical protein